MVISDEFRYHTVIRKFKETSSKEKITKSKNQEVFQMASLSLKNVCKVYPNGFEAVKDFNLDVADKEFIIFV